MGFDKITELPSRCQVGTEYKWKLEDMYQRDSDWEEDFGKLRHMARDISAYKGNLAEDINKLAECLKLRDELLSLNDKFYAYARMRRDEDNANPLYQAMADRAAALSAEIHAAVSYITPEIIAIDESLLKKGIDEIEGLSTYEFYLSELLRQKEHVLSDREEELLALAAEISQAPSEIFAMFNNADIKFDTIIDENGNEIELTKGRYGKLLESKDRRIREDAFRKLYKSYRAMNNTLASSLSNSIKVKKFHSAVRKYQSNRAASLDADNVPLTVYDNLIDTVDRNLPLLHRYLRVRKKALNLDELRMYDVYVPIVDEPQKDIPYEQAREMVTEGLAALGSQYGEDIRRAFNSGWVDVYENKGKSSGAYSWGNYLTHPFVLMNYQGRLNDVFTLAHEMGHAMHSYYTYKAQPYIYSKYKIFVAEVASTVNETLLTDYLLKNTTDKKEKAFLLNYRLEGIRGTLFRQTMFAEFERTVHDMAENGEALTSKALSSVYRSLNDKYFAREVVIDDEIDMEWARIPHFYSAFYVYKYATGISAAISFSRQISREGEPAVKRYLEFLHSGGSDYPLELLKRAGVDLTEPGPVEVAMRDFESTLDQLEESIED